jgi:hypothetical protein
MCRFSAETCAKVYNEELSHRYDLSKLSYAEHCKHKLINRLSGMECPAFEHFPPLNKVALQEAVAQGLYLVTEGQGYHYGGFTLNGAFLRNLLQMNTTCTSQHIKSLYI